MAQFDVFRVDGGLLVVDVQSDLIDVHGTRLVVPLISPGPDISLVVRLNPEVNVAGEPMFLATHLMSSAPKMLLRNRVGSLLIYEYQIKAAIDMLVSGF